jgi:hypothetical protein
LTEYFGNLALQRRRVPIVRQAGQVAAPRPSEIRARRIPITATIAPDTSLRLKAAAIRRSLMRQRLKLLLGVMAIIFAVTGVFALVVYRQAMILEMNFNNQKMANQISTINEECSQIDETLAQKTNLDTIRQEATSRLGLQDPARSQIIRVILPDSDRVVLAAPELTDTSGDAYLAGVFSNIEGYFRTIGQQRQGD